MSQPASPRANRALIIGALGVVFGDIGTSPLYAMRESFHAFGLAATPDNIFGVLSLIFWSLFIVITVKYLLIVMRADNQGEGGIIALLGLAKRAPLLSARASWWITVIGLLGASLFFGDAIITPAISVLSAVEGLEVFTPDLKRVVLPITVAILLALFLVQRHGSARVGRWFGPIMLLWFATLATLGAYHIVQAPQVLAAMNPLAAAHFIALHPFGAFVTLGAVVLAVTGGEALYADMGHFGRRPIRFGWLYIAMPALLLNYFGQGALLLSTPDALGNPFYRLAPSWFVIPLVLLATAATVIASQAVITGTFSVTHQAMQLGFMSRLEVIHTSASARGQIYLPFVNWLLLAATVACVLAFRNSTNLAAAYGVAVTGTMLATTLLLFVVARFVWRWPLWRAAGVMGLFLVIDLAYFSSNLLKIMQGGWFPLAVGVLVFTTMTTWHRGRALVRGKTLPDLLPLDLFLKSISPDSPMRVQGTAVFLSSQSGGVPHALLHNLKHNKILHERVVILTLAVQDVPRIAAEHRAEAEALPHNFYRLRIKIGFMEIPDIPHLLEHCRVVGLNFDPMDTSFFVNRQRVIPTSTPGMARWREWLFAAMAQSSANVTDFLHLPANRVIELGSRIEI